MDTQSLKSEPVKPNLAKRLRQAETEIDIPSSNVKPQLRDNLEYTDTAPNRSSMYGITPIKTS